MANKSLYQAIIRIPILAAAGFGTMFYLLGHQNEFTLPDHIFNQYLIGACIGALAALASFKIEKLKSTQVNYIGQLCIRIILIGLLFNEVYFHFWFDKVPDINLVAYKDSPFRDISQLNLQMLFDELSPSVLKFEGFALLAALLLLMKRNTIILGFGLLIPLFFYRIISNIDSTSDLHRPKIILCLCIISILPHLQSLYNYWFNDVPISKSVHPLIHQNHLYGTITSLKYFILVGFIVFRINQPNGYYNYYANNAKSPIKGAWTIKDINLNYKDDNDYETNSLLMADRIYLSSSRYGKIRMKDTLSTFEYLVDPSNNQFELWNFNDYRKLDLKGKFEYLSDDTIRFYGKNAKDQIEFTMVLDDKIVVE